MKISRILTALTLIVAALPLSISEAATPTYTPKDGYPRFALGADLSWTPYIEQNNLHTYYKSASPAAIQVTNIPDLVSDYGIDAVRLRVWVNPKSEPALSGFSFQAYGATYQAMSTFGTCSVEEMTTLARRFAMQGHRLMVVFQMSDTWADPAHQFIPEAWSACSDANQLADKAAAHVKEVLDILHDNNVNVAWVQIGNEVNNGMLAWQIPSPGSEVSVAPFGAHISQNAPDVPAETVFNFITVFHECAKTAKAIYPSTKTVLHLTHSAQWETLNWSLNLINRAGLSPDFCDYIGLSLYPGDENQTADYTADWKKSTDNTLITISNIYSTYGYRSLLCEIGMNNEYSRSTPQTEIDALGTQAAYIKQCNTDVRAFTEYLIDHLATDDSTCDGLFYWEPETDYMKNYTKGACVSACPGADWPRDKVTPNNWWHVIGEHSTFPSGGLVEYTISGVEPVTPDPADLDSASPAIYYDLHGRRVANPAHGIYIIRQGATIKKIIIK